MSDWGLAVALAARAFSRPLVTKRLCASVRLTCKLSVFRVHGPRIRQGHEDNYSSCMSSCSVSMLLELSEVQTASIAHVVVEG